MNEAEINRHGTPHDLMLHYSQALITQMDADSARARAILAAL